jgi:hypothetical protein
VVRRDHSCVGWIKLVGEAFLLQLLGNFINSFGNDQGGALSSFGKEIPHGAANGTRHPDGFSRLFTDRKLPTNSPHRFDVSASNRRSGFLQAGSK